MSRPKLIVLGTGFAAFSLVKKIDAERYEVTVVSPRNYFLFTPLLPSTTVGTIEFRSIIETIRAASRRVEYYQAVCTAIDRQSHSISCRQDGDGPSFTLPYDLLVLAVGAVNNTYGIPGVGEHAFSLRNLADARAIRQNIIECFERASVPNLLESDRERLLTFVVVGGGPTGVEFAAELHDFLVDDVRTRYPQISGSARIILLEATKQILSTFDEALGEYTTRHFHRQHIRILTGSTVIEIDDHLIHLKDGSVIPYGMIVWATGNGPAPLIESLPFLKDQGRILVDNFLRVEGDSSLFALGDCAVIADQRLPATAQVAQQQGTYLARELNLRAKGNPPSSFHYRSLGMLAYIGGSKALADLANVKLHGYATWLFWRSAYLTKLVSLKNKILVVFDWMKTMFFGRDVSKF